MNYGRWTRDDGPWTMDYGPWTMDHHPMTDQSFSPSPAPIRHVRERLGFWGELALAALPTITVLVMLAMVDALHEEQLLFASLASSAFLIYLDPEHGTNRVTAL